MFTNQPLGARVIRSVVFVESCDFHDRFEFRYHEDDNSSRLLEASREFGRATRVEKKKKELTVLADRLTENGRRVSPDFWPFVLLFPSSIFIYVQGGPRTNLCTFHNFQTMCCTKKFCIQKLHGLRGWDGLTGLKVTNTLED